MTRYSSDGIATRYGLDGPGSNPGEGDIVRTRPDWPWGPPRLPNNRYRVYFPGVKRQGCGDNRPPITSPKVKERVELRVYLYSPSVPSWSVLWQNCIGLWLFLQSRKGPVRNSGKRNSLQSQDLDILQGWAENVKYLSSRRKDPVTMVQKELLFWTKYLSNNKQ